MTSQGQALVYGAVITKNDLFKANHITQETGLQRQLVYYHLAKLAELGVIEKKLKHYVVVDRNELVGMLVSLQTNAVRGLLSNQPTLLVNYQQINESIELGVTLRSAGIVGHSHYKRKVNEAIDEAIDALKGVKRYLNSKEIAPEKALKKLEAELQWSWANCGQTLPVTQEEFENDLLTKLEALTKKEVTT